MADHREAKLIVKRPEVAARSVNDFLRILPLCNETDFAFDLALAELDGEHPLCVNRVSDRIYYFLSGEAKVTVGDDTFAVGPGDTVIIHKGKPHGVMGTAEYLVVTSPAFDPANESWLGP